MKRRRTVKSGVLILAGGLLLGGVAARQIAEARLRAHPEQRLAPLRALAAGPAWELTGQAEVSATVDGNSLGWSGPVHLAWAAPNRLCLKIGEGPGQASVHCDGKWLTLGLPGEQGAWRMPAPDDLTALLADPAVRRQVRRKGFWQVVEYFQTSPQRPLVADWIDGPDPASQWVQHLTAPPRTRAVTMALNRNLRLTCWLARNQLRRVALEAPPATTQAIGTFLLDLPRPPVPDLLPGVVAPVLPRVDLRMQLDLTSCGQPVDPAAWAAPAVSATPQAVPSLAHWMSTHLQMPLQPQLGQASLVGHRLPAFTARTLEGRAVSSSSLRGRPLVLEFGATWCPPSRDSLERLGMLQPAWSRQGVQFVAVFTNATTGPVRAFGQNVHLPLVSWHLDWRTPEAKRVDRVYRMVGIPRTLYVDRRGIVVNDSLGLQPTAVMQEYLSDLVSPQAAAAALASPAGPAAAASPPPARWAEPPIVPR